MAKIIDGFAREAGNAIADIRTKLFEEAWFGRAVTDGPSLQMPERLNEPTRQMSYEDLYGAWIPDRERVPDGQHKAQERELPEMDL